jgi:transcriptional regulator with XRE-family HTH domain
MNKNDKVFALAPSGRKASGDDAQTKKARTPAVTRTSGERVPWLGGVKADELSRPGGILLGMLTQRANELGHHYSEMASALGCTYGYISQLRNGQRAVTTIRDKFVDACANYLGVPRMTVLLAAGKVQPTDIYEDTHEVMQSVPSVMQFIRTDAQWGPLMPPEVLQLPLNVQYFIATLYQEATDRKLFPGASLNAEEVARQIEKLQQYRSTLRDRVEAAKVTRDEVEEAEVDA